MTEKFNPKDHMINLKGKDYLEVKWRLVWLREINPLWSIETELINPLPNLIMRAVISDEHGHTIASGHGGAPDSSKAQWAGREVEKAETAAIGRALAHAGYGTQFTNDDEGDHLADSPVERTATVPDTINEAKFMAHVKSLGLSADEALEALEVIDLDDYSGTRQEASDALDAYIAYAASWVKEEEEPAKPKKPRKPYSAKMLLKSLKQAGGTNGETLPIGSTQIKTLSIGLGKYAMNSGQENEVVFRYLLKEADVDPDENDHYSRTELWEPQADWFIEWLRGDPDTMMAEIENLRQYINTEAQESG